MAVKWNATSLVHPMTPIFCLKFNRKYKKRKRLLVQTIRGKERAAQIDSGGFSKLGAQGADMYGAHLI